MRLIGALILLAVPSAAGASQAREAFPGAEGFGRFARGGRGGAIMAVTNLNDAGPGSLRACIDAIGPRTCIFRVAGVIRFTTPPPIIRNPYLTIAGQTAPGDGILLTHNGGRHGLTPLAIKQTHDVVIRHIRVRPDRKGKSRAGNDAFTIEDSSNVVLDHVSGSWARDENVSGQGRNDNITISRSIFAEGVPPHDKCALLSSDPQGAQRFSFTGNLCAHNGDRNPDINFPPGSCVEVVNNVFYNANSQFAEIWESYGGSPVNIVGNVFKPGSNTASRSVALDLVQHASASRARIFQQDNLALAALPLLSENAGAALVSSPVCPLPAKRSTATAAYHQVLLSSGAFPRDDVDARIVHEVRTGTGSIVRMAGVVPRIDDGSAYPDEDADGMSDRWEERYGLDPDQNDAWLDRDRDGWSNFDEFLDHAHKRVLQGAAVDDARPGAAVGPIPPWLLGVAVLVALVGSLTVRHWAGTWFVQQRRRQRDCRKVRRPRRDLHVYRR